MTKFCFRLTRTGRWFPGAGVVVFECVKRSFSVKAVILNATEREESRLKSILDAINASEQVSSCEMRHELQFEVTKNRKTSYFCLNVFLNRLFRTSSSRWLSTYVLAYSFLLDWLLVSCARPNRLSRSPSRSRARIRLFCSFSPLSKNKLRWDFFEIMMLISRRYTRSISSIARKDWFIESLINIDLAGACPSQPSVSYSSTTLLIRQIISRFSHLTRGVWVNSRWKNDFRHLFPLLMRRMSSQLLVFAHSRVHGSSLIRTEKQDDLTETMKILMIFDRSFFTDKIVVIRRMLPIRPKKMNTNARMAPIKVACRVGSRISWLFHVLE